MDSGVKGLGCGIWGLGFGAWGLVFDVGFRVWGLGFRVWDQVDDGSVGEGGVVGALEAAKGCVDHHGDRDHEIGSVHVHSCWHVHTINQACQQEMLRVC